MSYAFVVFKDSLSTEQVLATFEKDIWIVKMLKFIFTKSKTEVQNKLFLGRELAVS